MDEIMTVENFTTRIMETPWVEGALASQAQTASGGVFYRCCSGVR